MTTIDRVELRNTGEAVWFSADPGCAPTTLGNLAGLSTENADASSDRVLLYLHGGALHCCALRSHQRLMARISGALHASVLVVDYRTLPQCSISTGVDDGVHGYRSLLEAGYHSDRIVLAVDSADGDLAIMVPMAIRELGLPAPASIVAISPLTGETDPDEPSENTNSSHCALLPSTPFSEAARGGSSGLCCCDD